MNQEIRRKNKKQKNSTDFVHQTKNLTLPSMKNKLACLFVLGVCWWLSMIELTFYKQMIKNLQLSWRKLKSILTTFLMIKIKDWVTIYFYFWKMRDLEREWDLDFRGNINPHLYGQEILQLIQKFTKSQASSVFNLIFVVSVDVSFGAFFYA